MKASDNLFELIKSLEKQEKRYFKVYSSKHIVGQGNDYIKLFDQIDKQKVYDEAAIKKRFKGESLGIHFPVMKNYLYNLILKSLLAYHADKTVGSELKDFLRKIEILYQKGLHKHCIKILSKAKNLAYKHEKFALLFEILEWEEKIVRDQLHAKKLEAFLRENFKEFEALNEKYKNLYEYKYINSKLFILTKKEEKLRSKMRIENIHFIINTPVMKSEKKALSFNAKYLYHNMLGFYLQTKGDLKKSYIHRKSLVNLFESNQEHLAEHTSNYIAALNNLLIICVPLEKYKEFHFLLRKMRAIPAKSSEIKARIFSRSYNLELSMYIDTGQFEKIIPLINKIEAGLKEFKRQFVIAHEMIFYYSISYCYLAICDYNNALKWLNKVLNETNIETREDIHGFARILNLIIHYELDHADLLGYITKSTYRFLYKRKRLYKFETSFLNFIRQKLPKVKSNKELVSAFKELKMELGAITKDPFEKKALEYFDFISWLESKIGNRPFAEIVKEKAKKNSIA